MNDECSKIMKFGASFDTVTQNESFYWYNNKIVVDKLCHELLRQIHD